MTAFVKIKYARTITKLIELDYRYKKEAERDSRAYRVYLTQKAKDILPITERKD